MISNRNLANQFSSKYLKYVLHGIWCSKMPKVVGILFFVLRMSLVFRMINPLIYKSTLSEGAKNDIKNQVRQVLVFYLGKYVELVNKKDGGIRTREIVNKKEGKELEEDLDLSGINCNNNKIKNEKIGQNYNTPTTKMSTVAQVAETSKVEIDMSKTTPAQAKYVNNLLNAQKKRGRGRPARQPVKVKKEVNSADSKSVANKRKSTINANSKKPAANKKTKTQVQEVVKLDDSDDDDKKENEEESSSSESEYDEEEN